MCETSPRESLLKTKIQIEKNFGIPYNSLPGIVYVFWPSGHLNGGKKILRLLQDIRTIQLKEMNPLDFIAPDDKAHVVKQ